jgi:predicted nucleic acid-binding protein
MTLYVDPSSLFKLYVAEIDTNEVRQIVDSEDELASSALAYAEMRATLAAAARAQPPRISESNYSTLLQSFETDWRALLQVWPNERLVRRAGNLAENHRLRGYDAVHLASALFLRETLSSDIKLLSHDVDLRRSAVAESLEVMLTAL